MKTIGLLILFIKLIYQASIAPSLSTNFNFILLGLDPRNDAIEKTNTTDTIVLGRMTSNWEVKLMSIPRDVWYYPLNAKINQIYPKSLLVNDSFAFIQNNFSDFTSLPIDRTIIITTQNLQSLSDIVHGVDVYLENGFTDNFYPNPEYIKNPVPSNPVYITVSYPKGWNHLTSANIAPFVRSRHSAETAAQGGTDLGRIARQQLLIDALVDKLKSPQVIRNPKTLLKLYEFWHAEIKTNFTDLDFVSLIITNPPKIANIKIEKITIPVDTNPKTDIFFHPKTFINPQWVFIPQDAEYKSFQNYIHQQFAILNY